MRTTTLENVAAALSELGNGSLAADVKTELAASISNAESDLKRSIEAIPSHHDGSLRSAMTDAVTASPVSGRPGQYGYRLTVDGRKMPTGKKRMPTLMNSRGWKHPVFGNRETWKFQAGHPYMTTGTRRAEAQMGTQMSALARRVEAKAAGAPGGEMTLGQVGKELLGMLAEDVGMAVKAASMIM